MPDLDPPPRAVPLNPRLLPCLLLIAACAEPGVARNVPRAGDAAAPKPPEDVRAQAPGVPVVAPVPDDPVLAPDGPDFEPPEQTSCAPLDLAQALGSLELTTMFDGDQNLTRPTDMRVLPDGRAFVVSQDGVIWSAHEVSASATLAPWLDLRDQVEAREECCREEGMFSLAFHPRFEKNGQLFVLYSHKAEGRWSNTVLSRLTVPKPKTGRPDLDSEEVLIEVQQPSSVHNGGQLRFGPDGYLYFSLGDGGGNHDPQGNGQNRSTLFGAISRIDVDGRSDTRPYRIPDDNPFVDDEDAAPEIFAYGFRNAWRFAFRPKTGELWAGDVGQDDFEELDVVVAGGNYGWKNVEGNWCTDGTDGGDCYPPDYVPPIHVYDHDTGVSITAGLFYTGKDLAALRDSFLFADFGAGTLWQVRGDARTGYEVSPVFETGLSIASFAEDHMGRLYLLDMGESEVVRLDPTEDARGGPAWAKTLAETGCFADPASQTWTRDVLPYDVQMPLWSDGADKTRAVVLPVGAEIASAPTPDDPWELPVGSTTIKTFARFGRPLETRFFVHAREGRWVGATYRWNAAGTDGKLLEGDEAVVATIDGEPWTFPSRSDCLSCHTRASGRVLGLRAAQLPEAVLEQWSDEDALAAPPDEDLMPWPSLDDDASAELRSRAYLASNCAHCHLPGGPTPTALDLRFTTPFGETGLCDAEPRDDLGLEDARVVAPGAPERSVLIERLASEDADVQMPPLGRSQADVTALAVLREWIASLESCP